MCVYVLACGHVCNSSCVCACVRVCMRVTSYIVPSLWVVAHVNDACKYVPYMCEVLIMFSI